MPELVLWYYKLKGLKEHEFAAPYSRLIEHNKKKKSYSFDINGKPTEVSYSKKEVNINGQKGTLRRAGDAEDEEEDEESEESDGENTSSADLADPFSLAFFGKLTLLKKMNAKKPFDVEDFHDSRQTTLLYTACRAGKLKVAKYLIDKKKADIDGQTGSKCNRSTPLHGAAFGGHHEIISYLLEIGADKDIKNGLGHEPLRDALLPATGVSDSNKNKSVELLKNHASKSKKDESEDDESSSEEDSPPKKKQKTSSSSSPIPDTGNIVKLIKKGNGVVDPLSGKASTHHVVEAGDSLYQCTLHQTNIVGANNNKFYVIQLLEKDTKGGFVLFTKWGRDGTPGSTQLKPMSTQSQGIQAFCAQFKSKTSNRWEDRDDFVKHSGKYQLMDMDLGGNDDDVPAKKPKGDVESKLDTRLLEAMKLIADKTTMTKTMKELSIDTDAMPLGKISKTQLKNASKHLKAIENELKKSKPKSSVFGEESANFYTLVPHSVGMCKLPVLNTLAQIKEKMELLETLGDLEIADKILKDASQSGEHPLDAVYNGMKCGLAPLDHASEDFEKIKKYTENTAGKTHTQYKLEVVDVFAVTREGEAKRYSKFSDDKNRMMLWHGSGVANWVGILSQGLRIAPPEAPVTGYMFGKGVYFADCSTKSANYCRASKAANVGFLTLNEVALGDMYKLTHSEYMDKPPKGKLSTKGQGQNIPDPAGSTTDSSGCVWPVGKMTTDSKLQKYDFFFF